MAANPFLPFALKAKALSASGTAPPAARPVRGRANGCPGGDDMSERLLPPPSLDLPLEKGVPSEQPLHVEEDAREQRTSVRRSKRIRVVAGRGGGGAGERAKVQVTCGSSTAALGTPKLRRARAEELELGADVAPQVPPAGNLPPPGKLLPPGFCGVDAVALAPLLLGKHLRHREVVLRITEGTGVAPELTRGALSWQFGPPGRAYVYLCYGLHTMLNITADVDGTAAACLIRACEPVAGLATIAGRRGMTRVDKPVLLTGPGKVGAALGLTTAWTNHDLTTPEGLALLDGPAPEAILAGPRVGIDYAAPADVAAPWRFAAAGTAWVSAPRSSLKLWTP